MHDAVRLKMFLQMLKGKALPDGFRDKVDKMVDDMDEEKVVYCALADLRTESFVRECFEWTGREACTECLLPTLESGAKVLWIF